MSPKQEAAEHIRRACEKDRDAGFAGGIVSKEFLDAKYGVGNWLPLPTFDHVQQNGKHRRIDNGLSSGHNEATAFTEDLELCNAFQPAFAVKTYVEQAEERGWSKSEIAADRMETCGEDIPDAYRWLPVSERDQPLNIVATFGWDLQLWGFQEVYGMLFGLSSSVMNFNPWTAFLQAVGRRVLCLLLSVL